MNSFGSEQRDRASRGGSALNMHGLTLQRAEAGTPSTKRAPGHQCKICDTVIPYGSGSLARHFLSATHQAQAREMGVYCSCGKNFLNPARFPSHGCKSPGEGPLRTTSLGFNGCQICGVAFDSQICLKKHKDSQQHLDRAKELGYKCECVRLFSDLGRMERHECFDKAMLNRTVPAGSKPEEIPPPRLKCTGCEMSFLSEKEFFSYHEGHRGIHTPVWTRPPVDPRAHVNTCQLCEVNLYQGGSLKAHKRMQSHIDLFMSKGLYCLPCEKSFNSETGAQRHQIRFHDPTGLTKFRCCDCHEGFSTKKLLKRHACPRVPPGGYHGCESCNLRFSSGLDLALHHLYSEIHKPLKCLGGGGCMMAFKDLPEMLQHLDSGACISKADRKTIDALLKKHDAGNAVKTEGAGERASLAALPSWSPTSHISSASASFEEMDTDSEGEDSGGVFLPS